MPSPARRPQRPRTVIQWHDDGLKPRVRHFLPDDASPYRALLLAGSMAVISVAAVVAVIQYQRHGSFPEMGGLVEMAAASPDRAPNVALPAKPAPDVVKSVQASLVTRPAPRPETSSPDVEPASAADAADAKSARIDADEVVITGDPAGKDLLLPNAQQDGTVTLLDPQKRLALAASSAADDSRETVDPAAALEQFETSEGAEGGQSAESGEVLSFAPPEDASDSPPLPEAAPRAADVVAAVQKPEVADGSEEASVRSAVNLRAGPSDEAKVLLTIPRGAKIQVDDNCRHWCAVTYDGRNGFVYKSFIRR